MKISTIYSCAKCEYQSGKWLGRCPQCEAWNSFAEEEIRNETSQARKIQAHARTPVEFGDLMKLRKRETRQATGMNELDRVLGGGVVPGSLLLLTGEPGIGKSTLTLQIADRMVKAGKNVFYVSGEESEEQIGMRAVRLGLALEKLQLLQETNLETILATAAKSKTDFLIVDSIQVMASQAVTGSPGSVSQVRLCTEAILDFAKPKRITALLIGHVTKDGTLAGPRVLEHLVDTVMYLDGSRTHDFRILRAPKNRYGSATEVGIFEMGAHGMVEVENPASYFIRKKSASPMGSALVMTTEGSRPILLEVQALTNPTVFGYPRRTASGFDVNRLQLLLAVIQKHCKVNLGNQDVYINVVAGYKLNDPAADLGVCLAILSSHYKKPLPENLVAIGEIGLSGEIRLPKEIVKLAKEVEKLGLSLIKKTDSLYSSCSTIWTGIAGRG